jgi:hypothetical protein
LGDALPAGTEVLSFNSEVSLAVPLLVRAGGLHTIRVVVDEGAVVNEADETNNQAEFIFGRPPVPGDLSGMTDSGNGRLQLRWQAPEGRGIAGYRVYRSTVAGRDYELVGGGSDTQFVDELAMVGTTYHYVVATLDIYGEVSEFSNQTSLTLEVSCAGDCGGDGEVGVDEIITMVNVALGNADVSACRAGDSSSDGEITIGEIIAAVNNALGGCQ